jgi:hypothetical protein
VPNCSPQVDSAASSCNCGWGTATIANMRLSGLQRRQRVLDFAAVSFVAGGPPLLVGVEVGEECESHSNASFPGSHFDRSGQRADRVGLEVRLAAGVEDVFNAQWPGAATVIDDVTPHP